MIKFFETMPVLLPETLPVGTRYRTNNDPNNVFRFTATAKLEFTPLGTPVYSGPIVRHPSGEYLGGKGLAVASGVDWSSVPIMAAPVEWSPVLTIPGSGGERMFPLCFTPRCSARGVAATKGNWCVYCANRHGRGFDEPSNYASLALAMTVFPGVAEARERLAAMDRAERPRGNPTEARELSKPHPWSCDEDV